MELNGKKFEEMAPGVTRELMNMAPLEFVIDSVDAFLIVLNLQLALTHPTNQGEGSKSVEDVARKLQVILGKRSRKAFDVLELGWKGTEAERDNYNKCKACGAPIIWERTKSGKFTPKNLDGSSHWATCLHAKQFKKGKTTNGKGNKANVAKSSNQP